MRSRVALPVLVGIAVTAAIFFVWRAPAQPKVVTVRWPITSPVALARELSRDDLRLQVPEAPLEAMEVAPGVRVREGTAEGVVYFEIILGDADFDDPLPLVVLLHGRGDRPRIPGGPFAGVDTPMRLVMPRGPLRLGAGYAWVPVSVTHRRPDALASALRERTEHLAALIQTLSATLPTLGRPVVAGFSQGGLLAFSLALHRPDVVGRAFPIAGWVPPALMPASSVAPELRVPIRSAHGTEDPIIPIGPTREVVAMLRALEWEVELVEFDGVGHAVSPEMNALFEAWLEEALREQAPELTGKGLGLAGPDEAVYEPFEPLERETIEAIEQLDANDEAASPTKTGAPEDTEEDAAGDESDPGDASDDADAGPQKD